MADLTRPNFGEAWASEGEKLSPGEAKLKLGWVQEMMTYQYENYLQSRQDEAILYLLQKGVPEYSATQEYTANKSVVVYQGNLYMATSTVTGVLPTVAASWKRISPTVGANGAVSVSSGGTGATTVAEARTNLGLGTASTVNLPTTNGVVVRSASNTLISRLLTGTSGNISVTNPDGVAGNINIDVGSNVAQLDKDSSWTSRGGITLPKGSSSERGVEVPGKIRYNTELQKFEGCNGTDWNILGATSETEVTTLSGDGITTSFTLTAPAFSETSTDAYIGGVWQNKGTYNVSGSTITFSEAPTPGIDNIQVVSRRVVDLGVANASQVGIQDTSNYYTATTVEGALREVGEDFAKLTSYTGTISADAEWSDVPAHSDPAFDVQEQALANQSAWLRASLSAITPYQTNGDIQAAAILAAEKNLPLITGAVDYELTNALIIPTGVTWISCGTRIKQTRAGNGSNRLDAGLVPESGSRIIGQLKIWMSDSPTITASWRAHVMLGGWGLAYGVDGFEFDEIVLEGGHHNSNGIAIAGNAKGIRGKRVVCAPGTKIGRAVMAHWGNGEQHYVSGGIYQHVAGAQPTTHPHDIYIQEISGDLSISDNDFVNLLCISAGYDIRCDRIIGSCYNGGAGGADLLLVMSGDLGFAYASTEEAQRGAWGIRVGQIIGKTNKKGIRKLGRALYYDRDSTPKPYSDYLSKIDLDVSSADITSTESNTLHTAYMGASYGGKTHIGELIARDFFTPCEIGNNETNVFIDRLIVHNAARNALLIAGSGADSTQWPKNISVGRIDVYGSGYGGTIAIERHAYRVQSAVNVDIGILAIHSMVSTGAAAVIRPNAISCSINRIELPSEYSLLYAVLNEITDQATDFHLGSISHASSLNIVPITQGITFVQNGRIRIFQYSGGSNIPNGIAVNVGDRFIAQSGSIGWPAESVITTAGVTGSTAVSKTLTSF